MVLARFVLGQLEQSMQWVCRGGFRPSECLSLAVLEQAAPFRMWEMKTELQSLMTRTSQAFLLAHCSILGTAAGSSCAMV